MLESAFLFFLCSLNGKLQAAPPLSPETGVHSQPQHSAQKPRAYQTKLELPRAPLDLCI
jgi:hypothetical protein